MRFIAIAIILLAGLAGCVEDTPSTEDPYSRKPALEFRPAIDLGSVARVGAAGTSCQDSLDDGDCGLGEPSVEVDGAGTIYVSGVCCLTVAPPVYASRDGGQTFQPLATPGGVREAFGIEGDFAVDEVGRVYFADIELAASFQVTVWDADGAFVRHTKWPAPPLVDRDWIRAEGDGTLYYVYNTGNALLGTRVYKSTDAGATWSPDAIHSVPYALGNVAIWPGKEICLFGGDDGGNRRVDCSRDGGETWKSEASTLPSGDGAYPVGAYDEAGNLYLAEARGGAIMYTWRGADGVWSDEIVRVSAPGTHRMPWIAAGADGAMAVAWYGTADSAVGPDSEWFVHVAASRQANADEPRWDWVIADPEPVFVGVLGRELLDFLQTDIGPDGAIHVAYSKQHGTPGPDGNEEQLTYVRSEASPLAATDYFWGP